MYRNSFSFLQYNFLNGWIYYYYHSLLLFSGFNRCPFQLLRSYKRHEENKRKIGQERSSMQQADYQRHRPTPWMQESVSMHKIPTSVRYSRMNQAKTKEEEKETEARRLMERKAAQQNKNTSEELKQGLPDGWMY